MKDKYNSNGEGEIGTITFPLLLKPKAEWKYVNFAIRQALFHSRGPWK